MPNTSRSTTFDCPASVRIEGILEDWRIICSRCYALLTEMASCVLSLGPPTSQQTQHDVTSATALTGSANLLALFDALITSGRVSLHLAKQRQ
ncbi:hypothetical protein RvY_10556-2 [Ramazzottius varieornatus]|uniref:Uncharacterized protein n=1 Tax=Ramazzottius varieornatus TaxID=947166 RepID=A0A1D1VFJ8_RAMVA|nr:hypothetical protein RvY_10556-2 [Ramazzottius varieornatus]